MSLTLKLNFLKGWPNPHINEFVSNNSSGVSGMDEGKIAHRDSTGKWVLGVSAANQLGYVLWNGAAKDGDHGVAFSSALGEQQVSWGGIQGIALDNPLEFETSQYAGTPIFGDSLYADTDGVLKICAGSADVASKVIVATVVKGVHDGMITVVPDNSRRTTS